MARDFTKNLANHMSLGGAAVIPLVAGSSAISIHAFVNIDTFGTNQAFTNDICALTMGGGSGAFFLVLSFDTGSGVQGVKAFARSQNADAAQTAKGGTNLSTGVTYSIGCVLDFTGKRIRLFVDGVQDVNATVTFGSNTLVQAGTTALNHDAIGGTNINGSSFSTIRQMDGRISEFVIFGSDIGLAGFQMLSDGFAADTIGPTPAVYFPLLGDDSPERDHYGGLSGTITGTIAQADHPRIIYPDEPRMIFPVTVTPTFKNYWLQKSRSLIGGGVR